MIERRAGNAQQDDKNRIDDHGGEGGGFPLKEKTSLRPVTSRQWPDYSLHTDIADAHAQLESTNRKSKPKRKK